MRSGRRRRACWGAASWLHNGTEREGGGEGEEMEKDRAREKREGEGKLITMTRLKRAAGEKREMGETVWAETNVDMKTHMNMEERAEMPGGSIKDLKVPRYLSAAGEFGYTSAKAPDRTSPPLLSYPPFFFPIFLAHHRWRRLDSEAPVAIHLWITGHVVSLSLFVCH